MKVGDLPENQEVFRAKNTLTAITEFILLAIDVFDYLSDILVL